jgi:2-keto-4-pentenoate hydratase
MQTLVRIAKAIVNDGFVTEAFTREDFYTAIKHIAKEMRRDDESPQQALARAVDTHPDARVLFAAMSYAKDSPLRTGKPQIYANIEPHTVSGTEAQAVGDPVAALNALAEAKRAANPELTREQAFSAVFTDPANAKLAAAEREARLARMSPQARDNK